MRTQKEKDQRRLAYIIGGIITGFYLILLLSVCMPVNANIFDWLSGVWEPGTEYVEKAEPVPVYYPTAEQQALAGVSRIYEYTSIKEVVAELIIKTGEQELRLRGLEMEVKTLIDIQFPRSPKTPPDR